MEGELIQISKINDFIFCPLSIYFHGIYESFNEKVYHDTPQTEGKLNHKSIDSGKYSSSKKILQGLEIVSLEWGLIGKLDIFEIEKGELIERKTKIKSIYDGYRYQMYCQMLCLKEAGFCVKKMTVRSLKDNKKFNIEMPDEKELEKLKWILWRMRNFNPNDGVKFKNPNKCAHCIYADLCV